MPSVYASAYCRQCVLSHFSSVRLCETLWSVARQAPPSNRLGCGSHCPLWIHRRQSLRCHLVQQERQHLEGGDTSPSSLLCGRLHVPFTSWEPAIKTVTSGPPISPSSLGPKLS